MSDILDTRISLFCISDHIHHHYHFAGAPDHPLGQGGHRGAHRGDQPRRGDIPWHQAGDQGVPG